MAGAAGAAGWPPASGVPSPLYRVYQERFGFSDGALTPVFGIYAFALLMTLLTVGALSDHVGRRPVLAAGLLLQTVSMVLFVLADGVALLLVARVVQGLSTGALTGVLGRDPHRLPAPRPAARAGGEQRRTRRRPGRRSVRGRPGAALHPFPRDLAVRLARRHLRARRRAAGRPPRVLAAQPGRASGASAADLGPRGAAEQVPGRGAVPGGHLVARRAVPVPGAVAAGRRLRRRRSAAGQPADPHHERGAAVGSIAVRRLAGPARHGRWCPAVRRGRRGDPRRAGGGVGAAAVRLGGRRRARLRHRLPRRADRHRHRGRRGHARGGLMSAVLIVGYLSFSVPAIRAGIAASAVGSRGSWPRCTARP